MSLFMRPREIWPFLSGVFLICSCCLMLQIVETRLISVMLWYHLAFFAISMAMLGMSAGSLLIYFKSDLFPRERLFENLVCISTAFSISVVLSTLSLITTIAPSGVAGTLLMTAVVWLKLIFILLPPYVLAGMAISLALTRSPYPVGVVYGVDLLGASSGCLIILVVLSWADAVSVLFFVAAIAAIGAACFGITRRMSAESGPPRLAFRARPSRSAAHCCSCVWPGCVRKRRNSANHALGNRSWSIPWRTCTPNVQVQFGLLSAAAGAVEHIFARKGVI
jgi:hypothetical protein